MRVRFSRRSINQLTDIREYIAQQNPGVAELVRLGILASIERLRTLPHLGRAGRKVGTRELRVRSLPFIIVYRVDIDDEYELVILGIFHAAQDR